MAMKLHGAKEVVEALDALSTKLGTSVLRSFLRKSIKEKAVAPWESAAISTRAKSNIKVASVKGSKTAVAVGPGSDTYWERFLQSGTLNRETSKGWNRGSIQGNKQMETAMNNTIDPIIDYANKNLGIEITRILNQKLKSTQRRLFK